MTGPAFRAGGRPPRAKTRQRSAPTALPTFRPVALSHSRGGNLPIELNTFIGREAELSQLVKLQATTRLLTLVGPGGVGKSRLALRVAAATRPEAYAAGIWFVELAMVTDRAQVEQKVADVIGIRERVGELPFDAIIRTLRSQRVLLILDNCEHLLFACSRLVTRLLQACTELDIIATSREPLETEGDVIWRVPPLSLPPMPVTNLTDAAASEAIQLFIDRARNCNPAFTLNSDNVAQLVMICRRLDGLPLALELVAARMGSMHEADIVSRLGLDFARGESDLARGVSRHQTLRATLDWSYRLLSDVDRTVLRRLAVFADGWTLKAAETVCRDENLPDSTVVEALGRLVARSLVMFDRGAGSGRYYLLETVKQYASERLEEAAEVDEFRQRHLAHFLSVAEEQSPEAFDATHGELLRGEQENVRAALRWAIARGNARAGLRLATATFPLWFFHGPLAEGRAWFERLLVLPTAGHSRVAGRARLWLGLIAQKQGDSALAEGLFEQALQQSRALGDRYGAALVLLMFGNFCLWQGDLQRAQRLLADAAARLQQLDSPGQTTALLESAFVAVELGDFDRATALDEESQAMLRRSQKDSSYVLYLKALVAAGRGESALAESLFTEARNVAVARKEHPVVGDAQLEIGHILMDRASYHEARASLTHAVDLAYSSGDLARLCRAIEALARSVVASQPGAGVRLAGAAAGMREVRGARAWPSDDRRLNAWLPDVRRRLKGAVYRGAWEAGRLMNPDEVISFVRSLDPQLHGDVLPRPPKLTPREHEVLRLVARAFSNQQIADELHMSVLTARTHVEHIFTKLRVHSRTEAALWAKEH
jgi:predicted ATPase/DNA-binding CsgD family transcriptional regulator